MLHRIVTVTYNGIEWYACKRCFAYRSVNSDYASAGSEQYKLKDDGKCPGRRSGYGLDAAFQQLVRAEDFIPIKARMIYRG